MNTGERVNRRTPELFQCLHSRSGRGEGDRIKKKGKLPANSSCDIFNTETSRSVDHLSVETELKIFVADGHVPNVLKVMMALLSCRHENMKKGSRKKSSLSWEEDSGKKGSVRKLDWPFRKIGFQKECKRREVLENDANEISFLLKHTNVYYFFLLNRGKKDGRTSRWDEMSYKVVWCFCSLVHQIPAL